MSSTPPPGQPVKRHTTGATGRAPTFRLPSRAESFAILSRKKNKIKTKSAILKKYELPYEVAKTWLLDRYDLTEEELDLKRDNDYWTFQIPKDDELTEDDKKAVDELRGEDSN